MPLKPNDRWNANHYKQLKFSLHPEIADAFKSACAERGLSMASVISQFMCDYSDIHHTNAIKLEPDKLASRRLREKAMYAVITTITAIYNKEAESLAKIPVNFRDSDAYTETERIAEALETALEFAKDVYC